MPASTTPFDKWNTRPSHNTRKRGKEESSEAVIRLDEEDVVEDDEQQREFAQWQAGQVICAYDSHQIGATEAFEYVEYTVVANHPSENELVVRPSMIHCSTVDPDDPGDGDPPQDDGQGFQRDVTFVFEYEKLASMNARVVTRAP